VGTLCSICLYGGSQLDFEDAACFLGSLWGKRIVRASLPPVSKQDDHGLLELKILIVVLFSLVLPIALSRFYFFRAFLPSLTFVLDFPSFLGSLRRHLRSFCKSVLAYESFSLFAK